MAAVTADIGSVGDNVIAIWALHDDLQSIFRFHSANGKSAIVVATNV